MKDHKKQMEIILTNAIGQGFVEEVDWALRWTRWR